MLGTSCYVLYPAEQYRVPQIESGHQIVVFLRTLSRRMDLRGIVKHLSVGPQQDIDVFHLDLHYSLSERSLAGAVLGLLPSLQSMDVRTLEPCGNSFYHDDHLRFPTESLFGGPPEVLSFPDSNV
jgi:hypothetical protein